MLPYKGYINNILTRFLDQLEMLLLQNMSTGEKIIYRKLSAISDEINAKKSENQSETKATMNSKGLPHCLTNTIVANADDLTTVCLWPDIKEIEQLLQRRKSAIIISGFGGIGKTTLARILYHKVNNQFTSVGWVNYCGGLKASLLSSIDLYDDVLEEDNRWRILYSQLKNDCSRKLIVINNVDRDVSMQQNPLTDDLLQDICGWKNTTVVITSRLHEIKGYYTIRLEQLSSKACIDLFYFYYSRKEYNTPDEKRSGGKIVKEIITLCGGHTFTIELLARSAKNYKSLEDFLKAVRMTGFNCSSWPIRTDYSNTYATIAEQLRKLFNMNTRTVTEKRILWDFSVLPNVELTCKEVTTWLGYEEAELVYLVAEGWLSFNETFSIHPLVKDVIYMDLIKGKVPAGTASKLIELVNSGTFIDSFDSFTAANRKLDIIENVSSSVLIPDKEVAALFHYNIGNYMRDRGKVIVAISHYQKSLFTYQQLSAENHNKHIVEVARVHNALGYLLSYTNSGRKEAEVHLREAKRIWCQLEKMESNKYSEADKATVYDCLGYLLTDAKRYRNEAELLLREALEIRCILNRKHPGAYRAQVAWTRDNLGYLLSFSNNVAEAEQELKIALEARCQLEAENPGVYLAEVTWTYNNLGTLLSTKSGRQNEAEYFYKRALEMRCRDEEEHPGMNMPDIAILYNNLGALYHVCDSSKAEVMYRKALEINRSLNEVCPDIYLSETAVVCNNLAALIQSNSECYNEAGSLYDEALQILNGVEKKYPGSFETDIADLYFNMAIFTFLAKKDILTTKEYLYKSLLIWSKYPECGDSVDVTHKVLCRLSNAGTPIEQSAFVQYVENLKIIYTQSGMRKRRVPIYISS